MNLKGKKLIEENEIYTTSSSDEMEAMIKFREKKDVIYISEIEKLELFMKEKKESFTSYKARMKADALMLKDVKDHCVNSNGLFLGFIADDVRYVYPIRDTAYKTLLERAKLAGFSILNKEDGPDYKALDLGIKVVLINQCLKLYKGSAKILLRDGKITSVMSGQYYFISERAINNGIMALKDFFKLQLKNFAMSHEFTKETYMLHSEEIEEDLQLSMMNAGIPVSKIGIGIDTYSGDWGNIAATYCGRLYLDDRSIGFGYPNTIKHVGRKTDEILKTEAKKTYAAFMDNINALKKLSGITINNPAGCLRAISKEFHLPKKIACEVATVLEDKISVSAYEVYWNLNLIVQKAEEKGFEFNRILQLQNEVAKTLFINYKDFDRDFLWVRDAA